MATATLPVALKIGPADQGRRLSLDEFIEADFVEGWLYELARGVVDVTEVPGPWHGRIVHRIIPGNGSCTFISAKATPGNIPSCPIRRRIKQRCFLALKSGPRNYSGRRRTSESKYTPNLDTRARCSLRCRPEVRARATTFLQDHMTEHL